MLKLPEWLVSALSDGSPAEPGKSSPVSMTRLLAFITVLSVIILPSIVIAELSLLSGKPIAIPDGWTGFMSAAAAAVTTLFIFNKRAE